MPSLSHANEFRNEGIRSDQNRIPPIVFRITILSLLAALGVSIAGGIYQASSHPSEQQQGIDLSHAAGIVFACAFGVMTIESLLTSRLLSYIITGDRILLFAIAAGFPFLLVRLIYIELVDFRVDYATLNTINGSVVAQGLLSVFPEFVVMIFFLGAGLRAPKIQRSQVRTGKSVQRSNQDSEAAYHSKWVMFRYSAPTNIPFQWSIILDTLILLDNISMKELCTHPASKSENKIARSFP